MSNSSFFKSLPSLLFFCHSAPFFFFLLSVALSLHCCTWAFSSCGEQGLLLVAVQGLLTAGASRCGTQHLDAQAQ